MVNEHSRDMIRDWWRPVIGDDNSRCKRHAIMVMNASTSQCRYSADISRRRPAASLFLTKH